MTRDTGAVGNPNLMIQVVSAPALIAAQNAAGIGNPQSMIGMFNPTQTGLGSMLPVGTPVLFQTGNWTPMIANAPSWPLIDAAGNPIPFNNPGQR